MIFACACCPSRPIPTGIFIDTSVTCWVAVKNKKISCEAICIYVLPFSTQYSSRFRMTFCFIHHPKAGYACGKHIPNFVFAQPSSVRSFGPTVTEYICKFSAVCRNTRSYVTHRTCALGRRGREVELYHDREARHVLLLEEPLPGALLHHDILVSHILFSPKNAIKGCHDPGGRAKQEHQVGQYVWPHRDDTGQLRDPVALAYTPL